MSSAVAHRFTLSPYPTGWYCLAPSADLRPGGVLPVSAFGYELAVFRTESGRAVAVDAYCPHLGANMARGGAVVGETLRCHFHGFRFDASGTCVATGYDTRPPPKCMIRSFEVHEVNGFVLAHFDTLGRAPEWRVPESDHAGWTRTRTQVFRIPCHVQDFAENSVDIGHLRHVHSYESIETLAELELDGPVLRARYAFRRPKPLIGTSGVRAVIDIAVRGLGYSQVEVKVEELGLCTRQFVLATPVDETHVDLRIGMAMTKGDAPSGFAARLIRLLPHALFDALVARSAFREYVRDVSEDIPIWTHKRYADPPRLAEGDGPIGRYRRWARQFYPEPADASRKHLKVAQGT